MILSVDFPDNSLVATLLRRMVEENPGLRAETIVEALMNSDFEGLPKDPEVYHCIVQYARERQGLPITRYGEGESAA